MEVFDTWDEADEARQDGDNLEICGGYHTHGEPFYFLMPADADDVSIRDAAFSVKEGRDLGAGERRMIDAVEEVQPGFLEVDDDDPRVAAGGGSGAESSGVVEEPLG